MTAESKLTNREMLIEVRGDIKHIVLELRKLDDDKQRQWEKIDDLGIDQSRLKGWIAGMCVLIPIVIAVLRFI